MLITVSSGDLKAQAQQDITYNSLQSFASADLNAIQGSISLDRNTVAKGNITLTLQSLDLSNDRSKLVTAGTLIVNAGNANLANSTLTFGGLALNLSGSVDASNAKIRAVTTDGGSGDIAISASTVITTSAAALLAANDLTLTLASLTNTGQLAANNNLTFNIAGNFANTPTGLVYAGQDGRFYVAGDLLNDQGAILVGNDLTIAANASGGRNNSTTNISGLIEAGRDGAITTANLTNKRLYVQSFTTVKYDPTTLATFILNPEVADKPFMHLYQGANDDNPSDYLFPDLPRQQWEDYEDLLWSQATLADGTSYRANTWISSLGPTSSEGIRDWIAARVPRDAEGNILLDPNNPSKYFVVVRQGKPADSSTTYEWDEAARISQVVYEDVFNGDAAPEALIQTGRNLVIDATVLNNSSSTIEAEGNAVLRGQTLNNEGVMGTRKTMIECHAQGACEAYDANGKADPSKDMANGSSILVKTESFGLASSNIKAAGNLDISGFATVNNTSAEGSIAGGAQLSTAPVSNDPTAVLNGLTAAGALFTPNPAISDLLAGKGISISGNGLQVSGLSLSPAEIIAALGSRAPKPSSGGFGGTIPGQTFLYETRAEFLDVGSFYGSGYFIDRIGYRPEREVPFLGDAYFENELVDKQLRQLVNQGLGKGSFIPGSDAIEQMKVLLDRGADFAKANGLTIGEKLSPQLIANLTETMVWYEKKSVNGIEVLVPTVYVANTDKANLTVAGALISGGSLTMNVGAVNNSGSIGAKTNLQIAAANITATGGSFTAGNDLSLSASQNLTLNAQTLSIGGQNVVNPNAMVDAGGNASLKAGETLKLQGAGVEVGGDAALSAQNITLDAQKVEHAGSQNATGTRINTGGDLGIAAENDVTVIGSSANAGGALDVIAEKGSVNIVTTDVTRTTDDGYSRTTTTTQQQSQLSSGRDLSIKAEENVLISGSSVDSGGDAAISAGQDVNITAAQNSGSVTFGKNSGETVNHSGSEITAKGDISIAAGENGTGNLNIVGSQIAADETVNLQAADNVTIAEARDTESYEFHAKTGKKATTDATLEIETAVGSSISGKTGVNIGSGKDTTISASKVQAGDEDNKADLNIDAGGDLIVSSGKDMLNDETKSKQKGFLSKTDWASSTDTMTSVVSSLTASGNISVSAGNDAMLIGTQIDSGGAVFLGAGNDIVLAAAQDVSLYSSASNKKGFLSSKAETLSITQVTNKGVSINAVDGVTILSVGGNIVTAGSQLASSSGDINLTALTGDVYAGAYTDIYTESSTEKTSYLGGLLGSTNISNITSEISTGTQALADLDLSLVSGQNTALIGSQLAAGGNLNIVTGGDLSVQASLDSLRTETFSQNLGLITMTTITEQSFKETTKLVSLLAGGKLSINVGGNTDVFVYNYDGQPGADPSQLYPKELLSQPGLQLIQQLLADEYYYDKQTQLSPAFKALLTVAVGTFVVPGLGLGNLLGLAADSWQLAAANAFTSSVLVNSVDAAVAGNLDLGDLLKDAAVAGLGAGLTSGINVSFPDGSAALDDLVTGFGNGRLTMAGLVNGAVDNAIQAGVHSLADGGDFADSFVRGLIQTTVGAVSDAALFEAGDFFGHGTFSVEKLLAKALINCGAAAATDGSCASGAIGSLVTEAVVGLSATGDADELRNQVKMTAAVVGWLTSGGDPDKVYATVDAAVQDFDNNILPLLAMVVVIGLSAADAALTAYDAYQLAELGLACDGGNQAACAQAVEMMKGFAIETGVTLTVGAIIPGDKIGMKIIAALKKHGNEDVAKAVDKATDNYVSGSTVYVDTKGNALIGEWSTTNKLTSPENALAHWKKHQSEFPEYSNVSQYVESAQDFVNNPPSSVLIKNRNGDSILYDPVSDIFAVKSADGAPRTMFRPDPSQHKYPTNMDYFNAQ